MGHHCLADWFVGKLILSVSHMLYLEPTGFDLFFGGG